MGLQVNVRLRRERERESGIRISQRTERRGEKNLQVRREKESATTNLCVSDSSFLSLLFENVVERRATSWERRGNVVKTSRNVEERRVLSSFCAPPLFSLLGHASALSAAHTHALFSVIFYQFLQFLLSIVRFLC